MLRKGATVRAMNDARVVKVNHTTVSYGYSREKELLSCRKVARVGTILKRITLHRYLIYLITIRYIKYLIRQFHAQCTRVSTYWRIPAIFSRNSSIKEKRTNHEMRLSHHWAKWRTTIVTSTRSVQSPRCKGSQLMNWKPRHSFLAAFKR